MATDVVVCAEVIGCSWVSSPFPWKYLIANWKPKFELWGTRYSILLLLYLQCLFLTVNATVTTDAINAFNSNVVRREVSEETNDENVFKECGGLLRNKSFGVITTPNFPDAFPVPIYCRWVIEAKPGKVIALYLTQFFLREGLKATEYAFFADNSLSVGKKYLGSISFDDESTFIITNQPLLVLELEVYDAFNIHMRVMDYFLDVYGFNITYEIVSKSDSSVPKKRVDTCSVFKCSFTGHCFASETFDRYFCSCFPDFFGKECEFGPKCDSLQSKNDCQNGGMCRYSRGSSATICKCPDNYYGNNCEIPKLITSQKCKKKMDCSIECKRNKNHSSNACDCRKSFEFSDYSFDCNRKGQVRYLVAIKVYDSNVDLQHLDKPRYSEIKSGLEFTISSLLKPYLYSENTHLSILEFKPGAVVTFHFFHSDDEDFTLKRVFQEALRHGRLGRYVVDKSFLQFEKEAVVNIIYVKANEEMPILENRELKIDCFILGSQSIEVSWFKDGSLINVNRSSERSISQTINPKNVDGYFTASLHIAKVTLLDSGLFTCQVKEWGFTANASIAISVQTFPKPIITPLTQTVFDGDTVLVVCFAREDLMDRKFGYNWLKNGEILNPSEEQEVVEDIFPTGSRIILKASKNVVYTCLISSALGTVTKNSAITVLPNRNTTDPQSICPKGEHEDISWQMTAVNVEDIQLCPTNFEGEAKRKCILINGTDANWDEPDFSNCISEQFKDVKLQFTKLKLGYETGKETTIVNKLKKYVNSQKLRHSEGEAIVQFLRTVFDYFHTKADRSELRPASELSLDILSTLLDQPDSVNKHSIISTLHELIVEYSLLCSKTDKHSLLRLTRSNFVVELVKISADDKSLNFPLKYSSELIKRRKLDKQQMNTIDHLPKWLTDSVFVNFSPMISLNSSATAVNSHSYSPNCVVTVFYKNLAIFLPKRFLIRRQISETSFQVHSRLLTVALFYNPNQLISKVNGPKITAFLNHHNITEYPPHPWRVACGMADFGERIGFHTHQCETKMSHSSSSVTMCVCNLTGTYGVILTTQVKRLTEVLPGNHDFTGIVGCAICTLFVLLSLVILTAESRCSINAIRSLKIQVCIAVIGANFSFIATLYPMVPIQFHNHTYSLLLFFLMAVFSLQICFCAIIYSQIAHVSYTSLQHPESKLTFLGWVIPVSVEGATIAAQAVRGFPSNQWSLQYGTTYFYGTIITTGLLFTFHLFLYITIRVEFIRRRKVETLENIARIKAATAILNQSLVINCVFENAIVATIAYVNIRSELFKQIFVASYVALGLFILISYSFCIYHDSKLSVVCNEPEVDKEQKADIVYEMNHLQLSNASPPPIANHTFQ